LFLDLLLAPVALVIVHHLVVVCLMLARRRRKPRRAEKGRGLVHGSIESVEVLRSPQFHRLP
jgi:hypothetical protein